MPASSASSSAASATSWVTSPRAAAPYTRTELWWPSLPSLRVSMPCRVPIPGRRSQPSGGVESIGCGRVVGGVGVANAVKGHLDRRRDVIATLKSLGATGGGVFMIYLTQVMVLATLGALPGLALGAALPFLIAWGFGAVLPLPLNGSARTAAASSTPGIALTRSRTSR